MRNASPGRDVGHVSNVHGRGGSHPVGERQPERTQIGGENTSCAGRARNRDAEEPDRAAAEHGDRLPREIRMAGREHRVAERLLERRDLRRQLRAVVLPENRFRHRHITGERAVTVDPENLRALTHVHMPGTAVEASAARDVALRRHVVTGLRVADAPPRLDDGAGKLVAQR
jgi:hypothetical protein